MNINIKKISRIALAIFVVFSVVGFASPLFATIFPTDTRGVYFGTRISVNDTDSTYSIADTNYLQGGHMQVASKTLRNAITAERRSLGMLVTVDEDGIASNGFDAVTYRLISNRGGGAGCPTTVTDNSYDGKSSACATTVDANWAVAVPSAASGAGQFLTTDGTNFAWAAISSGGSGGPDSFFLTTASASDFSISTVGSAHTFNFPAASASTSGRLLDSDWRTFNGKQDALTYTPLNPANDLSDVLSASNARTNLGLGTAATMSAGDFLASANNLSDLTDAANARTNLGLGSIALLNNINNIHWSGAQLTAENGGTGQNSYTTGDLLYASGSNVLSKLAIGTNGQILTVNASGVPEWMTNLGGFFDGTRTITRAQVATAGAVGGTTLSDFINNFFFPAIAPVASLTLSSGVTAREYGMSTTVNLAISAQKKTNPVTSITLTAASGGTITSISGDSVISASSINLNAHIITTSGGIGNASSATPTQTTFGGTGVRQGTVASNTTASTTFTLTVSDGANSSSSTQTITYQPKIYLIKTAYDYLANPLSKSDATISAEFRALADSTTCGSLPCSTLTSSSSRTWSTGTLAAQYFYYAVPVSISGSIGSSYNTGGFKQNSSTGTPDSSVGRKTVSFTNGSGYTQSYYIYGFHANSDTEMAGPLSTTGLTIYSP